MKIPTVIILTVLLLAPLAALHAASVASLRCEYLNKSVGIDVTRPRLSWNLQAKPNHERFGLGAVDLVPANTTATVYVPAKDAAGVTESGKPVVEVKGVKFLHMENGAAVYVIGSRTYQFQSSLTGAR